MRTEGKIRTAIIITVLIILAYLATGYTYELYRLDIDSAAVDTAAINRVNIDGSDFTPIFKLLGYGVNGFVWIIASMSFTVIILIASLILLIPIRVIGLNRKRKVDALEPKIVNISFIIIAILSLITGGILSRMLLILPLIVYNAVWMLCAHMLCIAPLSDTANEKKP